MGRLLIPSDVNARRGSDLKPDARREALATFSNRFTGDRVPAWSRKEWKDGKAYPLQFASDADWLANTWFAVKRDGGLDSCFDCHSCPTWPNNPELRQIRAA